MDGGNKPVIDIRQLVYTYDANERRRVLDGVDLRLEPGGVVGLLGKNGAGKTTLMECLLGFLKPEAGSSEIFGESSRELSGSARQRLAYVPQANDLYPWMTGEAIIAYTSKFYSHWNQQLIDRLVADWEVPLTQKVQQMSAGEAQKLGIVLAMGHEPDLLILDEPVSSLDPAAKRAFLKHLIELNSENDNTILFSTHITSDIERVAADVAILKAGKTYFQGGIDDLKERVMRVHLLASDALPSFEAKDGILSATTKGYEAVLTVENYSEQLKQQLEQQYAAKINAQPMNLEDIFVALAA